ncbi:MAG: aminotransferase, partial [Microbacterium sp. 14-71-5]
MSDEILPRIREEIAALPPYRQGKQAGADAFKLSSNENPFDPLPSVLAALSDATPMNRYPDATAGALRVRLGERYGVAPDAVHVASGSVAILYQLVLAAATVG